MTAQALQAEGIRPATALEPPAMFVNFQGLPPPPPPAPGMAALVTSPFPMMQPQSFAPGYAYGYQHYPPPPDPVARSRARVAAEVYPRKRSMPLRVDQLLINLLTPSTPPTAPELINKLIVGSTNRPKVDQQVDFGFNKLINC